MSVFQQACETSTCVPFPFSSDVCASRSHKCFWSVSRRAEQKLLKAFGPRLGRSRSSRQLRFWDVCSACRWDGTQINSFYKINIRFISVADDGGSSVCTVLSREVDVMVVCWLYVIVYTSMEEFYLHASSFLPFCMHSAINSQYLWNFLAVILLHIWWFGCSNFTELVLEQRVMKQKCVGGNTWQAD